MLKLCLGFLVDTLFCVNWLARLSIFIHADILVLVSEFVVVVILSKWWLFYLSSGQCRALPITVGTSLQTKTKMFNINVNCADYMHKSVMKPNTVYVVTYDMP